jgi:cell wall-associated NlpC family hydrolase
LKQQSLPWACAAIAAAGLTLPAAERAEAASFGSRTLAVPKSGPDVRVLQQHLTRLGIPTAADGSYGPATRRSVRRYERRAHIYVDGRVSRFEARGIRRRVAKLSSAPAQAPALRYTNGPRAVLSSDGRTALAPRSAPRRVQRAIAAANRIVDKPYRYGGGHGSFEDSGYDCSGTVSYALHGAHLLSAPRASSGFTSYGQPGKGKWISVFANSGHAYMIIAGLRLDTSGPGESGPRWRPEWRSGKAYVKRHPGGL